MLIVGILQVFQPLYTVSTDHRKLGRPKVTDSKSGPCLPPVSHVDGQVLQVEETELIV